MRLHCLCGKLSFGHALKQAQAQMNLPYVGEGYHSADAQPARFICTMSGHDYKSKNISVLM